MSASRYRTYMMGTAMAAVLGMLVGCTQDDSMSQQDATLKAEAMVSGSRAEDAGEVPSDDALNEASLAGGLQIFVFDEGGRKVLYQNIPNAQEGEQAVLETGSWQEKLGISAGQTYDVYALANAPKAQVEACNSIAELEALTLSDDNIYKVHTEADKKYFLMDQHIEWKPTEENRQTITLDALKRAAAKIQLDVNINVDGYQSGTPHFRLENYNIMTSLLEKDSEGQVSVREMEDYVGNSNSFKGEDGLSWNRYLAYSYSFSWAGNMDHRPSVLVEMPMTKTGESNPHYYYYRIPICAAENTSLERNHIYRVKAKITSLGSSSELKADMLADVQYSILPWQEDSMDVNVPDRKFLMVTPELLFMRNVAEDSTSVKFYASGACELTIEEVYYYDKNAKKQTITKGNSNRQYPSVTLKGTTDGTVSINSSIPTNLTVKYIRFRIALKDDANTYKEVLVKQYPIEYAQSISGWYSTRSEKGWITPSENGTYCDYKYGYGWNSDYGYYAKVYKNGKIYYLGNGGDVGLSNNEMYVIQITSTNGNYVISHPNIDYTNPDSDSYGSKDNVVSPAFMIASQLGAVFSDGFDARKAITHCKTYREVAQDGTKYDGWRLPTNAEVKVISDYQGQNDSPIAVVLAGRQYRTLSQELVTGKSNGNSGQFVRCVRDLKPEEIEKLEQKKQ